jgi:GAF domain-containing protein
MPDPTAYQGARLFADIARDLSEQTGVSDTLHRIIELARVAVGCDVAIACELRRDRHVRIQAATDDLIARSLQHILDEIDEGVAHEALVTQATVRMDDIEVDTRWSAYRELVRGTGLSIRSALAFPLGTDSQHMGALAVYSNEPSHFTDADIDIVGIFADHAAIALEAAGNADQAENMRQALESNRRIGMAIGILMSAHRVTDEQAFAMLRIASQHSHVKLRDVAEAVILTGEVPSWPSRRIQAAG